MRILIVEDDATIARLVAEELEKWGYQPARAEDFSDVMGTFRRFAPQLVLMDLSLPHRSGFYWCEAIRAQSQVPVIFISSAADSMNLVTALHQGADDFIAKPFDLPVLVAKVQALLRRSYDFAGTPGGGGAGGAAGPGGGPGGGNTGETIELGGALLHQGKMALEHAGQSIELSRNEFRILQLLAENRGRVVSREAIMRRLWDDEHFIDDNTLTVNINRLRKKLAAAGLEDLIATKKGAGYLIRAGGENGGEEKGGEA